MKRTLKITYVTLVFAVAFLLTGCIFTKNKPLESTTATELQIKIAEENAEIEKRNAEIEKRNTEENHLKNEIKEITKTWGNISVFRLEGLRKDYYVTADGQVLQAIVTSPLILSPKDAQYLEHELKHDLEFRHKFKHNLKLQHNLKLKPDTTAVSRDRITGDFITFIALPKNLQYTVDFRNYKLGEYLEYLKADLEEKQRLQPLRDQYVLQFFQK